VTSPTPSLSTAPGNLLLPVLPLRDVCLFPEASLSLIVTRSGLLSALEVAGRSSRCVLAVAQRDPSVSAAGPRDLHVIGTLAFVTEDIPTADGGRRVELDGLRRGRVITVLGVDTLVAEIQPLDEGDPGEEWGGAVEALARYLHAHADLRAQMDRQRRSKEPMSWVNLACQTLPITASARQRLLESDAAERCQKIGRGLDALLRKEQSS
jgi:ATP-dependent Lon protease